MITEPPDAESSAVAVTATPLVGAWLTRFGVSSGFAVVGPPASAPLTRTEVNGPQLPAASWART